jgi:adenylosuccinate synthase
LPAFVIVGAQWGDEGKGKIVDLLTERVDIVARYGGGPNAGHTIVAGGGQRLTLHHIPSGILRDQVLCVIGNGVVVDPASLIEEIERLRQAGVRVEENLRLSDRAHVILPYHRGCDVAREDGAAAAKIGTTRLGVGPAYESKSGRYGVRVADLFDPATLQEKVTRIAAHFRGESLRPPAEAVRDPAEVTAQYLEHGRTLQPYVADTAALLNHALDDAKTMLCEGAQGTMLDLDHGTYPYVTSSSSTAGGACTGLGISPIRIEGVFGVLKAYSTRVGEGPFPTEQDNDAGRLIRERGREFGSTTGRPRRCGWFDAVVARYAASLNQIESLALTLFDVLDGFDELPIAVAYEHEGQRLDDLPADPAVLRACRPIYETLPGWKSPTSGVTRFEELPEAARAYVRKIEQVVGCEVGIVSVGPERSATIVRPKSRIVRWLPSRA